jgi:hypothetical protein
MKYLLSLLVVISFLSCKDEHAGHDHSGHDHASHEGHDHGDHEGHDHGDVKNTSKDQSKDSKDEHIHGADCGHNHVRVEAPNGGTLIKLGGDAAVLELVLDQATGELKVYPYTLEGVKTTLVKLEQEELVFNIINPKVSLSLKANEVGIFEVQSDALKTVTKFEAETGMLEVEGLPFDSTVISYPEGN